MHCLTLMKPNLELDTGPSVSGSEITGLLLCCLITVHLACKSHLMSRHYLLYLINRTFSTT